MSATSFSSNKWNSPFSVPFSIGIRAAGTFSKPNLLRPAKCRQNVLMSSFNC